MAEMKLLCDPRASETIAIWTDSYYINIDGICVGESAKTTYL